MGPDATGATALGNRTGILYAGPVGSSVIGGFVPFAGNVNSGNGKGVALSSNPNANGWAVQGNIIGLDASGTTVLPNTVSGVEVNNHFNTIGGTNALARNIISGNAQNGILISGGSSNQVLANYIGTDITAANARPNGYGLT